ncbi:MAG: response regulator transcription factor [Phyllobacteriaceae bacterium]|nr:response regulator transcription factor [Phyllobacteriaceae bacterium]
MTRTLVLIADDDPIYRSFITDVVEASDVEFDDILQAEDGEAAVSIALTHKIDQVVLDLQMPKLSGVDAARQIWANNPAARILFWSSFADEAYVRSLMRIVPEQASYGYILKSTTAERLQVALEGVFIDGQYIVDREIRGLQARTESRNEGLSHIEYDMLIDISLGFTDQYIAERHNLSTRGVQSRLQKLYTKLGVGDEILGGSPVYNPRTRAISVAILRGLLNSDLIVRARERHSAEENSPSRL